MDEVGPPMPEEAVLVGYEWWPLVALFVAALVSSISSALTAFGLAIIFHVVLQLLLLVGLLSVELPDVVVYIIMMGPFSLWPIFILYRHEVDWRLFGLIFPLKVVFTFVGTHMLVSYESATLKKVLGFILLVFAIWKVYMEFKEPITTFLTTLRSKGEGLQPSAQRNANGAAGREHCPDGTDDMCESASMAQLDAEDEESAPLLESKTAASPHEGRAPFSPPLIALILVCAVGSGLMGGMFGVSGPPLMIIVTFASLDKGPLRSTFMGIFALTNLPQSYFLYRQGLFSWDSTPSYIAVAAGSLLGTVLGNAMYKYISTQMLLRGIIFLLICSCLTLLDLPDWVLIAFCIAFGLGIIGFILASVFYRRQGLASSPDSSMLALEDERSASPCLSQLTRRERGTYMTIPAISETTR